MSEHRTDQDLDNMDFDAEIYLAVCDLKAIEHGLSGDTDLDSESKYGLWRVVDKTIDRLNAIKDGIWKDHLKRSTRGASAGREPVHG